MHKAFCDTMEFEPFDIGRFLIAPDRKFHCLLIKTELVPGVMERLASIAAKYRVRISYVSYSMPREYEKPISVVAFIDVTDATAPIEQLLEEARKIEFVKEIKDMKPEIEGFALDLFSFPLVIDGKRAIVVREQGIRGIINGLRKRLGSAAEAIQYFLGFEAGLEYGKSHKKLGEKLGIKSPSEILSKISAPLFTPIGFGVMKILKSNDTPPYTYIRVYRCFECECAPQKINKPYSHLVRGMIAGVSTEILGMEMTAKEIKCIAMGDPYCEFEVYPRK